MSGIFSIDGNIGSGKSTAVGLLKGKFGDNVIFVDEPVDIWNSIKNKEGETILKKFYETPHIWAFSFQMMAGDEIARSFDDVLKDEVLMTF